MSHVGEIQNIVLQTGEELEEWQTRKHEKVQR
jgi:hypothetical protein